MDERPYDLYRQDAETLAAVGRALSERGSTSDLPTHLADAALASWLREDIAPLVATETDEQQRMRSDSACLALIGLAVEIARDQGIPVVLHPETAAEAIAASRR